MTADSLRAAAQTVIDHDLGHHPYLACSMSEHIHKLSEALAATPDAPLGVEIERLRDVITRYDGDLGAMERRALDAEAALAATPDAPLDVERLRTTIHNLRWCKWSDTLHAIAHDDGDEDGHRAAFLREYAATLDHKEPGSTAG